MKRMVIFVFYDFEGIVDGYVRYLLQSLEEISEKIVIVSNGRLDVKAKRVFESYTEYIYQRDNKGYDAGAYKDVFMNYLKDEDWQQWDEVIMLNDTFYGPVYPWQEVFNQMDHQNVDFWGMTKGAGDGVIVTTHIQSYFLSVRKKMLISDAFHNFWVDMEYPENLSEAVINFEGKFTNYFCEHNFKYLTYMDVVGGDYNVDITKSPYIWYVLELLTITRMPLVKRKALTLDNIEKAIQAIEYISDHTEYDVNLIKEHMIRWDKHKKLSPYSFHEIDDFCKRYPKVYIYGHGKQGHLVEEYLRWRNHVYEKFIVTEKTENDRDDVISYKELEMDDKTGIILAVGRFNLNQILPMLDKEISETHLLVPRFWRD